MLNEATSLAGRLLTTFCIIWEVSLWGVVLAVKIGGGWGALLWQEFHKHETLDVIIGSKEDSGIHTKKTWTSKCKFTSEKFLRK